ncbi:MAG: hypothetical protein K9L59_01460 [Desulfobacterales bacterium]|nr:hypothetical protein [Desulfobacterales bacterium]
MTNAYPADYKFTLKIDKIARNPCDPHNFESKYHIKWDNASQFFPSLATPKGGRTGNENKPIEKPIGFW